MSPNRLPYQRSSYFGWGCSGFTSFCGWTSSSSFTSPASRSGCMSGSVRSVIENNKARGSAAWAWHWFTIYTSKSDVFYCIPVEYSRHLLVPCLPCLPCLPHPTKWVWAPEVLPVGLKLTLPSFGPRALVGPLGGGTIVLWIRALEMCIDVTLRPNLLVTLWC